MAVRCSHPFIPELRLRLLTSVELRSGSANSSKWFQPLQLLFTRLMEIHSTKLFMIIISRHNQLVYVGLSRVKTLEGLHLTKDKNDFTFHHAKGTTAPNIKEINDEYLRLDRHPLKTLVSQARRFIAVQDDSGNSTSLILTNLNVQSLYAQQHIAEMWRRTRF
ncbi:hypothetical protein AVEN_139136-1 [Araneus ventricosus]|uniref:Uncharacterized protein n=1 Tax=Araneus ventricosus TaxID=182803 RepID=A0A4Y2WDK4_ARAVE|nr:hypothetical protein AVEN_139136-1 [Araneus ventricosus]